MEFFNFNRGEMEDAKITSETNTEREVGKPPEKSKEEALDEKIISFESLYGIKREELESIESFNGLTDGQKAIALENFSQFGLKKITEQAIIRQTEGKEKANIFGKIYRGVFANQYLKYAEKEETDIFVRGGLESHKSIIEKISEQMKDSKVDADINPDGSLNIYFAERDIKNLNPKEREKMNEFNEAARIFATTPAEWQYSGREQDKFTGIKERYEKSLEGYIGVKRAHSKNDGEAAISAAETDQAVHMHQLLNTDKDVEKYIRSIASESSIKTFFRSAASQNIGFTLLGGGIRSATVAAWGLIAAPFVAAGMGAFLSRKRAILELQQEAVLARSGKETKIKRKTKGIKIKGVELGEKEVSALNFVDAKSLTQKIDKLYWQIASVEADNNKKDGERKNEIAELREELATRLLYTDIKMERGLVNYGSTNDRLANQYALLKSRSMAAVETMKNEKEGDENKTENIAMERLESFLEMKNDKAHAHVRRAAMRGAYMGAGFALLGYEIRDAFSGFSGTKNAVEFFKHTFNIGHETTAAVAAMPGITPALDTTHIPPIAEKTEIANQETPAPAPEGRALAFIEKKGSIWQAARNLVNRRAISEKEFQAAWENPKSTVKLPNGATHHISEIGLSHEGDEVIFMKEKDGVPAHFEFVADSKKTAGTDKDLMEVFAKKRVKIPKWLESRMDAEEHAIPSSDIYPMKPMPLHLYPTGHVFEPKVNPTSGSKTNYLPPDFLELKHEPQIPEIGAKNAPPIEHAIPDKSGNIIEQIEPGKIKIGEKNMWGIIKFNYNDSNHSINLDETYFKNLSGNEVLKYKHYEILKEKIIAERMSTEISESYNNMTVDGLRLNKYLKVYESISKNPTYTKETSLVASSIKFMIREMIKKYGDVIDPNIKYFRY